jgi:FkbM family methyltransferase
MDFEAKLQVFYESVLDYGMNAIDVGAHAGRHSVEMVRCVGNSGKVIAYEPIPDMYEALTKMRDESPELKSSLVVHPYAISNHEGTIDFCLAADAPWYSGILERQYDTPTRVQHISVESHKLDNLVDESLTIHYIKIDTEGAEWEVLKGAEQLIERCRPYISFEFGECSYRNYQVDPNEVFEFFERLRYRVYDITGNLLDKEEFSRSSVNQHVWDYLALPVEKPKPSGF